MLEWLDIPVILSDESLLTALETETEKSNDFLKVPTTK